MNWIVILVGVPLTAVLLGLAGWALVRTVFGRNDYNDRDGDGDIFD